MLIITDYYNKLVFDILVELFSFLKIVAFIILVFLFLILYLA